MATLSTRCLRSATAEVTCCLCGLLTWTSRHRSSSPMPAPPPRPFTLRLHRGAEGILAHRAAMDTRPPSVGGAAGVVQLHSGHSERHRNGDKRVYESRREGDNPAAGIPSLPPHSRGKRQRSVYNPLKENADGTYSMDFDNLAEVADEKCRLPYTLQSSQPGRHSVGQGDAGTPCRLLLRPRHHSHFRRDTLRHGSVGQQARAFATASEKAAQCSITFGAPSKTFNIAGIVSSYSIVPNPEIRKKFYSWLAANELNEAPMFSPIATIAAFEQGEQWRRAMLAYVEDNIRYVEDYCREHLPMIRPLRPEASFLVWLDCRKLGLNHDRLIDSLSTSTSRPQRRRDVRQGWRRLHENERGNAARHPHTGTLPTERRRLRMI